MQEQLARAGYKATRPRQIVFEQIVLLGPSFGASALLDRIVSAAPEVGRATVFRTLDLLVELGLLQRVHTETAGNWGHSYVLCGLGDTHHHHLVCNSCGLISDFRGCFFDKLIDDLKEHTGFVVEGHSLELYGKCERCQEEAG